VFEMLSKWDEGAVIGLVAVAGTALTFIVGILAAAWSRVRRAEIAAALKQDMLNRGFTAQEIVTVVHATRPDEEKPKPKPDPAFADDDVKNLPLLMQAMAAAGYEGEDIEKFVQVWRATLLDHEAVPGAAGRARSVQEMIDQGYEGNDIERVVRAFGRVPV
jgi:hypothetical protein